MKKLILLGVLIAIGVFAFTTLLRKNVRPVELRVVDAITKAGIPGVKVYYELEVAGPRHILGIPILDPIHYRVTLCEAHVTDNMGMVKIPARTVKTKLYERLYLETIAVNLDVDISPIDAETYPTAIFDTLDVYLLGSLPNNLPHLLHSKPNYQGVVINSSSQITHPDNSYDDDLLTVRYIIGGLQQKEAIITVELKPANEAP